MSGKAVDPWLFWSLLVAAKACVVLGIAAVFVRLLRHRSSAERHLVWLVAVAAVLVLPVLTLSLPAWRVALPGAGLFAVRGAGDVEIVVVPELVRPTAVAAPRAPTVVVVPRPAPAPVIVRERAARVERAGRPAAAAVPGHGHPTPVPPREPPDGASMGMLLLAVWLGGALVVGGGIVTGLVRAHLYVRRAQPLRDPVVLLRAQVVAGELGVHRMRLYTGAPDAMPMTFGVLRPAVLLPSSARRWSPQRLETVLRHELAHVRRRDSLTQLLAEIACALYWFNPLAWLAARRMYVEREHACDDLVLMTGARPSDYAAELLAIARTTRAERATPIAAIAMARPSQLRGRITALLEERQRRAFLSGRTLAPSWLGALVVIIPVSALLPSKRMQREYPVERAEAVAYPLPPVAPPAKTGGKTKSGTPAPAPVAPPVRKGEAVLPAPSALPASAVIESLRSLAPQAPVLAAATQWLATGAVQEDCLSGRNRSINHNSNDDVHVVKWSGPDCSGEVRVEGDVQFDPDFTRIVGLSRDGLVRITVEEGRTERRVTIRPGAGGVTHEYSVNGRVAEFDAAAERWLASTMLMLFRNIGFMAQERASAILERHGVNALITESGLLRSDHTRATYLKVAIERGRLDERALRNVLELAGNAVSSDHYRAEIIGAVAGRYEFTDGVRQAYLDAASRMSSDHYRHQAFTRALAKGNLSDEQVGHVLREARRISSDHYRAELLNATAGRYALAPGIRAAYLDAATSLRSDHYRNTVLLGLLKRSELNAAELARVVEAGSTMSDHYRADLLGRVAAAGLADASLQTAFLGAARGIKSDHYKQQVLSRAAARDDLSPAALTALIDAAASIASEHYRAELLVDIARRHRLEGATRDRYIAAMDAMKSSTYQGRVATALLRQR